MDDNKVAILLENLQSQFQVFSDGLQALNEQVGLGFATLNNKIDGLEHRMDKMDARMDRMETNNYQEHQQLMQMIKEIDRQVQVEIKRVK